MNRFFLFAFLIALLSGAASAQDSKQVFLKNVFVSNGLTLVGDAPDASTPMVKLWGVKPIDTQKIVASEVALEQIISGRPINCSIKRWVSDQNATAQCIGGNEIDLALSLVEQGYAMADRAIIANTIFEGLYTEAEEKAISARSGLWYSILPETRDLITQNNASQFQLTEGMAHFLIFAMIMGPFIGMLIVGFIIYGGFKRLINLQRYQMAMSNKRDRAMRAREKFIVAASMEGELNTNRAKLDAFIIIYEQVLKNLRDPLKDHKYKKGGDIIHKKPALSRNVYDSNIDKLDLLGHALVPEITQLYMSVEPNPDYKTIEPDTPIDEVIEFVSGIIRDAESMLPLMDKINSALNVIVRDKKSQAAGVQ
jgi:endonuclease YncB( thermonuclease family)